MADKITMKIDDTAHQKLQMVKALMGVKTLSEALRVMAEEYIEMRMVKRKK